MTSSLSATTPWQFDLSTPKLRTTQLCGSLTLDDPATGICQLKWKNVAVEGSILGISADESGTPREAFTRGTDLVAVYTAAGPPSFNWQVYWRANQRDSGVVLLDTILSLQTDLLESFPSVTTRSQLAANEALLVCADGATKELDPPLFGTDPIEDCDCLVLRSTSSDWSYAEMTHPLDQCTLQLTRSEQGLVSVRRKLGGSFLERGVIRRMRIRGAFLPRESDLERAAELFTELATELPPLTA